MARLGRRLRDSVSVTYYSTLPSTSPTSSYHPNHSNRALTIRTHHSAKPHVEPPYMAACNFARRVVFFRSQITRISRIFHAACRGCFFAHRLHGLHGFSPCGLPAVVFRSRITQIARIFPHAACRRLFRLRISRISQIIGCTVVHPFDSNCGNGKWSETTGLWLTSPYSRLSGVWWGLCNSAFSATLERCDAL